MEEVQKMQENKKGIKRRKSNSVFGWVVVVVFVRHYFLGYYPEWLLVEILQPEQFLVAISIYTFCILNIFLKTLSSLSGCLPVVDSPYASVCKLRIRYLIYLKNPMKFNLLSNFLFIGWCLWFYFVYCSRNFPETLSCKHICFFFFSVILKRKRFTSEEAKPFIFFNSSNIICFSKEIVSIDTFSINSDPFWAFVWVWSEETWTFF